MNSMIRNVFKAMVCAMVFFTVTACNNDDEGNADMEIGYADLPEASRTLIETNFQGATKETIVKKNMPETDGTLYEVSLSNNVQIDFNTEGSLTNILGNSQPIPDGVVPEAILQYIQANYPDDVYIEEIDTEPFGYEVELSNDVELYFDQDGNFISEDTDDDEEDDDDEITISYGELPQTARTMIETHFSGAQAVYVNRSLETDDDGTIFEVKLDNGFELDFDVDGNWTDIEGNDQQVPDALILSPILTYTQANYPAPLFIEGIETEDFGFQVEISNDVDLQFDAEGNFLGIDD